MRVLLMMMVVCSVSACAVDPAHVDCGRRLVPINAPAPSEVKDTGKPKAMSRARQRGSVPAGVPE